MKKHEFIFTMLFVFGFETSAQFQSDYHIPVYTGTPLMISAGVVTQQNLNRALSSGSHGGSSDPSSRQQAAKGPEYLVVGTEPAGVPAKLAASLPQQQRADAERIYQIMLNKHPELMKQLEVRSNDIACGVATFLAGSYMAFNQIDFPDKYFKPLYEQVRKAIAADKSFAETGMKQRRELYERTAIIGTFLALSHEELKKQPNAKVSQKMKNAARGYLKEFLKMEPEQLKLSEKGLTVN